MNYGEGKMKIVKIYNSIVGLKCEPTPFNVVGLIYIMAVVMLASPIWFPFWLGHKIWEISHEPPHND